MVNWLSQSAVDRPARNVQTFMQRLVWNAYDCSPLCHSECLTTKSYRGVVLFIVVLFFIRAPIAVFRAIGSIIIATFHTMTGAWSRSHISKEIFKRLTPTFTNSDASPTIAGECFIGRIQCSLFHTVPRFIFWWLCFVDGLPVGANFHALSDSSQTAATCRASITQSRSGKRALSSADTLTQPVGSMCSWGSRGTFQNSPTEKGLVREINESSQDIPPLGILNVKCAATQRGTEFSGATLAA